MKLKQTETRRHEDTEARRFFSPRRRVALPPCSSSGFTLLELIVTLTVLAIMVFATLPLAQNAYKRQKEQQLRETLREIRLAIDEFKRDTYGACPQGAVTTTNPVRIPAAAVDLAAATMLRPTRAAAS